MTTSHGWRHLQRPHPTSQLTRLLVEFAMISAAIVVLCAWVGR